MRRCYKLRLQNEKMLQAETTKKCIIVKREQETCENKDCSNTSTLCKMENPTKELLASSSKENASKATGHKKRGSKRPKAKQLKLKSTVLVA